jgi:putative transposase
MAILKQSEAGAPVPDLCREHGMSSASCYKWRAKFGGMDAPLMSRLKELEDENRRLKKMYADVQPLLSFKNAEISDWLIRLAHNQRAWGGLACASCICAMSKTTAGTTNGSIAFTGTLS